MDPSQVGLAALADRHYAAGNPTRKAKNYLREYERLLAPMRDDPLRVLEMGVSSGASLLVWRDYLPRATVVGLDIDPRPDCLAGEPRIHFLRARQDDQTALDRAAAIAGGPFDLIVDDASHIGYLAKRSFHYLFRQWLRPGGTYVIEDFGTGYLSDYPDSAPFVSPSFRDAVPGTRVFASHQSGMVGVVKQLIEPMMQEMITGTKSHLPIERLLILPNIAFVGRADDPPGPVPDDELIAVAPLPDELKAAMERVAGLEARVIDLEANRNRLLAPFRRLSRRFRSRR